MNPHLSQNPLTPPNEHYSPEIESIRSSQSSHNDLNSSQLPTPARNFIMGSKNLDQSFDMNDNTNLSLMNNIEINNGESINMSRSYTQLLDGELQALDSEVMGEENTESIHIDNSFHDGEHRHYDNHIDDQEISLDLEGQWQGNQRPPYSHNIQDRTQTSYIQYQNQPEAYSGAFTHTNNTNLLMTHNDDGEQILSEQRVENLYEDFYQMSSHFGIEPMISDVSRTTNLNEVSPSTHISFGGFSSQLTPSSVLNSHFAPQIWPIESNPILDFSFLEPSHRHVHDRSSMANFNFTTFDENNESSRSDNLPVIENQSDINPPTINNLTNNNATVVDNLESEEPPNFDLYLTLRQWCEQTPATDARLGKSIRRPRSPAVRHLLRESPEVMQRNDLKGEQCDIQRINWKVLGISRTNFKNRRKLLYRNYTNIKHSEPLCSRLNIKSLINRENYFRFRRMDFNHEVHMLHFQLRNLIACPARDHIFYVGRSKILHCTPSHGDRSAISSTALDLTNPQTPSLYSRTQGIQITTMAVGYNVLIAGGFCGEYGLINLNSEKGSKHIQGLITEHPNGITNHIQIHTTRSNTFPVAAFASNHTSLRLLDIYTNTVISEHHYEQPINCSAISPDQRLRVMVGDTCQVLICNSETGKILHSLNGHHDFGFACDWADDGWTVATGNQDQQIKIWDARKWTTSHGIACPVASLATNMAGARKLKFSPLGSGKRVLVAAEAVDYINIIDAESFTSKQMISLFGEISGFDFTNDGQDLFVANSDSTRGGIMEFERSNFANYGRYDLDYISQPKRWVPRHSAIYDWMSENDVIRHPKAHVTLENLERKVVSLGADMGYF